MKRLSNYIITSIVAVLFMTAGLFSSCSDDMPAESYYTFTGEMMSDYLKTRSDFSLYARIIERAGMMDLLSARGTYTMFPPTNEAINSYLKENNYASVEDIPQADCDTIALMHLMNKVCSSVDFTDASSYYSLLEMPLILVTGDKVDENNLAVTEINGMADIINTLKDDSVQNGIIHPVNHVILPNTENASSLLEENNNSFQIYCAAFKKTGLLDSIAAIPYYDQEYEETKENYPDPWPNKLESGDPGNYYTAWRPSHLKSGFTFFVVPDDKLIQILNENGYSVPEKAEGQKFTDEQLNTYLSALYKLAYKKYEPTASYMGISSSTWKQNYEDLTAQEMTDMEKNPLYLFMSYHILDRFFLTTDKFVNCWGVHYGYANPTEWISTFLPFTTMKLEAIRRSVDRTDLGVTDRTIFLNHRSADTSIGVSKVRGAMVSIPSDVETNTSQNCGFYYIDDVLAYDEDMTGTVMNTRMRIDAVTLFPELTNNDMRLNGDPQYSNVQQWDTDPLYRHGKNYYAPQGYLKGVTMNDDAVLLIMRPHNTHWNFGGDEINVFGSDYSFTFTLPTVPPGNYEIRLGLSCGWAETRGVAQIYFDGKPQGIPIDMRITATDATIGGDYSFSATDFYSPSSSSVTAEIEDNNKVMKNNGAYRTGKSIISYPGGVGQNYSQPTYDLNPNSSEVVYQITVANIYRRVICTNYLESNKSHTITVSSVYSGSPDKTCFMLDYIELVPLSVCGVGGVGEDDF